MQKKKGFTLVELVIVIAVIAILAGVLIGTFASVINKANESAKLQEMKAAEHEQKADDLLKKIDNSNWYGWEDFETSIVEKMTKVYQASYTSGTTLTVSDVQKAVKDALVEYAKNNASQNTQLTEEQVKVIVEDAIGKVQFNGVTEAQVRAIVSAATSSITATQLTASQVKSIVNAAADKGLTAAQVAQVVGSLNLATSTNVNSAVNTITTAIANAAAAQLTTEDLANALIDLLPVTYKVANQTELSAALEKVNSFSTLNFTSDFAATINVTDNRTLTISGVKLTNLIVNAPLATIYLVSDEGTVKLQAVAGNSAHISGKIESLEINKGRAVVEEGGEVTALKAAPTSNAVINVEVQPQAKVGTFNLEFQYNDAGASRETVTLKNDGVVDNLQATKTSASVTANDTTTNVVVSSSVSNTTPAAVAAVVAGTNLKTTVTSATTEEKYATTTSGTYAPTTYVNPEETLEKVGDDYVIRSADELRLFAALVNGDTASWRTASYKLTTNVDISDKTWIPAGQTKEVAFAGKFDGGNFTILGMTNHADYEYRATPLISASTQKLNVLFGFFNHVISGTVKNVKLLNIDVKMPYSNDKNTEAGGGVGGGLVAYTNYSEENVEQTATTTISSCEVSGLIDGFDCLGAIVGRSNYKMGGTTIIENCTSATYIYGHRTADAYCRVGGIVGFTRKAGSTVVSNCTFTGKCVGQIQYKEDVDTIPDANHLSGSTGGVTFN